MLISSMILTLKLATILLTFIKYAINCKMNESLVSSKKNQLFLATGRYISKKRTYGSLTVLKKVSNFLVRWGLPPHCYKSAIHFYICHKKLYSLLYLPKNMANIRVNRAFIFYSSVEVARI